MISTLSVPLLLDIQVIIHEIEGGGFWAEVPRFPGCVAQAETKEAIPGQILSALQDWLSESPEKTEAEARQLAKIQGSTGLPETSYPQTNDYLPPLDWSDEDE